MSGWAVTVRNAAMVEVGPLNDYAHLDLDARLMAAGDEVGTLTVVVPNSHRSAAKLVAPGAGLVLRNPAAEGFVEWSGQIVDLAVTPGPDGTITAVAESDDAILRDEIASPTPSVDVSTSGVTTLSGSVYDVRTGTAEAVALGYVAANIGPAGGILRRRYAWLQVPSSAGRGASGTWRFRHDDLLTVCRRVLGPSGLAFRLVQGTAGHVVVEIWTVSTAPRARFSVASGTATDAVCRVTAPRTDEVIVGGEGAGTARALTRRASADAGYARRRVKFVDSRSTADLAEMRQSADELLADDAVTASAEFTAVSRPGTPDARYGIDYRLGDIAQAAIVPGVPPVVDRIRQVRITHEQGRAPVVRPTIGVPSAEPSRTQVARVRRDIAAIVRG